ncbi:MAG TPA: BatD family protein [Chitinophagaceae bacterium]|jgi:hypothetical protein
MRIRKSLLILCLLPTCLSVSAQVKFSTVIDQKEISKSDYLEVQYVVENAQSVDQITPPSFEGFTVIEGPSQQSSVSVINGAVSKSQGISFTLKPTATGQFTIPGARAIADGKQLQSNSIVVRVTNGPSHSRSGGQQLMPGFPGFGMPMPDMTPEVTEEYLLRPGEKAADKIKDNLLVKLDVSKTSCYLGEPFIATYKLCSRLKSESRITKRPSLDGFSVYDMVQPEIYAPTIEKINGKEFNVHIIRKVQLYPLQDGSFTLDPTELDNTVHFIRVNSSDAGKSSMQQLQNDYMNDVAVGEPEEQRVVLASKPATITVKPLPAEGKPLFFDGAVGKFIITASLDSTSVGANEIARLKVKVTGQGNLPVINAPQVSWPQGIDLYDPSVKEDDDKTICPISGSKEFDYSFSVKQPGRLTIPPVQFAYFDPKAAAYKIVHTDSLVLDVTKSNNPPRPAAVSDSTASAAAAGNEEGSGHSKLLIYLPMGFLMLIAVLLAWRKRQQQTQAQQAPAPVAPAPQPVEPIDPFEAAKHALQDGNSQLFYKATGQAIWNTLAEQLHLGSSQLNKPVVTRLLREKGVAPAVLQQLDDILLETQMALYTPVHSENDMKATLAKAEEFVRVIKG